MKKASLLALVCALCSLCVLDAFDKIKAPQKLDKELLRFYNKRKQQVASEMDEQECWAMLPFVDGVETNADAGSDNTVRELMPRTLPQRASLLLTLAEELRWRVIQFLDLRDMAHLTLTNRQLCASTRAFLNHRLSSDQIPRSMRLIPWRPEYGRVRGLLALESLEESEEQEIIDFVESLKRAIVLASAMNQYDVVVELYMHYLDLVFEELKLKHILDMLPSLRDGDMTSLMLFITAAFYNPDFTRDAVLNILYYILPRAFDQDERVSPLAIPGLVQFILDTLGDNEEEQKKFFNQLMDLVRGAIEEKQFWAVEVALNHIPWVREHIDDTYAVLNGPANVTPLGAAILAGAPLDLIVALMDAGVDPDAALVVDIEGNFRGAAITTTWLAAGLMVSLNPLQADHFAGPPPGVRLTTTVRRCAEARRLMSELMPRYLDIFERYDSLRAHVDVVDGDQESGEEEERKNEEPIILDDDELDVGHGVQAPTGIVIEDELDWDGTVDGYVRSLILAIAGYAVQHSLHKHL